MGFAALKQTYLKMYQNESRAIVIALQDQNGEDFEPSSATRTVLDSDGEVVAEEQAAMVDGNDVSTIIDTTVTGTPGDYTVRWKLLKTVGESTYTYYHKTQIRVEAL